MRLIICMVLVLSAQISSAQIQMDSTVKKNCDCLEWDWFMGPYGDWYPYCKKWPKGCFDSTQIYELHNLKSEGQTHTSSAKSCPCRISPKEAMTAASQLRDFALDHRSMPRLNCAGAFHIRSGPVYEVESIDSPYGSVRVFIDCNSGKAIDSVWFPPIGGG
jgi:hypothetical protein